MESLVLVDGYPSYVSPGAFRFPKNLVQSLEGMRQAAMRRFDGDGQNRRGLEAIPSPLIELP
jgi:hypothetical protein